MTVAPALADGIRALKLEVEPAAQVKLLSYVRLLAKWNGTYNLTAVREPERMVHHHLLDSLAVLPHLPEVASLRIVDVGSGCGAPGIPIAIARTRWHVTLLDSSQKKAAFLRQAANELGLANVQVAQVRAEDYYPEPVFDIAISRAYSDLTRFARHARQLTGPEGQWLAMKGKYPREEIAELPTSTHIVEMPRLKVPGVNAERYLVVMGSAR